MSALQLSENMLLQVGNDGGAEQMRVLWLEPARVASPRAAVIFTTRKKGMPEWRESSELSAGIASGLYLLPARDELLVRTLRNEEELTELEKEKRNARFDLIKDMVLDPERHVLYADVRRKMILEVCRLRGTPTKTIYHHLRLWWQRGQTANALLPDYINVGRPGSRVSDDSSQRPKVGRRRKTKEGEASTQGTNVDTRTRKLLVLGAERFYEKQKLSMKAAFDLTLKSYFTVGHIVEPDGTLVPQIIGGDDCPTIHQFEYHHNQALKQKAAAIRRKGLKRYLLEDRPRLGTTMHLAPGPGSRYEVDATRGDVALLSSLRRTRIIGRPVIFIVRDVFSRIIVGFYICLEGPNWTGLRMALQSAMMDKVEFCRRFGRVITADEWPCAHRPETIFGDRGPAELLSKHADFLFNSFAIRADNAAPSRPDWKPVVERFFRTMNDKGVHWQPGAVHGARSRGEPDSRLEAIHTLESFNRLFLEIVLHYNNYT